MPFLGGGGGSENNSFHCCLSPLSAALAILGPFPEPDKFTQYTDSHFLASILMLSSITHIASIPLSDFSDRKFINVSHRFLSHYMTRLSYSNHPDSSLWSLRVWSCSLCSILCYVLSTLLLNFFGSQSVCTNLFVELLVTIKGADSSLLVHHLSIIPTFLLGRPENVGRHYHPSKRWEIPNDTALTSKKCPPQQHRCENLGYRPLSVSDVHTHILKTGFEMRLAGSGYGPMARPYERCN